MQKVADSSDHHPIPKVPQSTRQDECHTDVRQVTASSSVPTKDVDGHSHRDEGENNEKASLVTPNPKYGARIEHQLEI